MAPLVGTFYFDIEKMCFTCLAVQIFLRHVSTLHIAINRLGGFFFSQSHSALPAPEMLSKKGRARRVMTWLDYPLVNLFGFSSWSQCPSSLLNHASFLHMTESGPSLVLPRLALFILVINPWTLIGTWKESMADALAFVVEMIVNKVRFQRTAKDTPQLNDNIVDQKRSG